jgi:hypothetical protein
MGKHHDPKKKAIRDIRRAIRDLKRAKEAVRCRRFEKAEDEIGDALINIGRAIHHINKAERKYH